jgi:5,5'-dehydrodivanillate O-demethylase oxygenase subunit
MLSIAENEALTRVGPGTPGGTMLRRYWWPVEFAENIRDRPVKVRLLGQDFVLFRDGQGRLGFLDLNCAHRLASLEHGRVEANGIRCCYHGWLYDVNGRCLEQPAELPESRFVDKVCQGAYAVCELGSMIWAYIGPAPVPVPPRYDILHRTDGVRIVRARNTYCNWLQLAEGGIDLPHLPFLHAGVHPGMAMKTPTRLDYEERPYGFMGTMWVEGMPPRVIHCVLPAHNRIATTPRLGRLPSHDMFLRTPVDDDFTLVFGIKFHPTKDAAFKLETIGFVATEPGIYRRIEDGYWNIESRDQDRAAQESQGPITDRSREFLGPSDRGVVLYRKLLRQSIDAVARGEAPLGVSYDPAASALITFETTMGDAAYVAEEGALVTAVY